MTDFTKNVAHLEQKKENVIRGLQAIQAATGWLSDEALVFCSKYFNIPLVEVEGVVSFYAQFKRQQPGRCQIAVCDGTACHIKGTPQVVEWLEADLKIKDGETDKNGLFSMETVACLGCCSLAPVIAVNGKIHGHLTKKSLTYLLKNYREEYTK